MLLMTRATMFFSAFLCLKGRSPPHPGESCPQGSGCRPLSTSLMYDVLNRWGVCYLGKILFLWKWVQWLQQQGALAFSDVAFVRNCCAIGMHIETGASLTALLQMGKQEVSVELWIILIEPKNHRFICRQQNLWKPDTDVIIWRQRCHSFTLSCSKAHRGFSIFIGFTTNRIPDSALRLPGSLKWWPASLAAQSPPSLMSYERAHCCAAGWLLHLAPSDQWSRQSCLLLLQTFLLDA